LGVLFDETAVFEGGEDAVDVAGEEAGAAREVCDAEAGAAAEFAEDAADFADGCSRLHRTPSPARKGQTGGVYIN
jgi:hypothetical protein